MPTDRLYQHIVNQLRTENLNAVTFEKIAVRIAASKGLGVLPMPGGQDAGLDGAIVDVEGSHLPGPLVVTMQRDGVANLRKNLRTHADTYPDAAKVAFFVTTRPKTPKQKHYLTVEAGKLGYALLGVADEAEVAEYLYYHPEACFELLGFRGVRSALSHLPPRRRMHWDIPLVSREDAIDQLRHLDSDKMLTGIPGTGKTSLLSQLSAENIGLFVCKADRDLLAQDLREHRPTVVFVDGLDNQYGAVQELVRLREETGIDSKIVVTGWHEDSEIVELLGLGPDNRIKLERLDLDQLVEVVHRVGLRGPRELVQSIVRQAGGSPGLAVTLTMACRNGNAGEVITGAILLRQVQTVLRNLPLDPKKAEMALAAISIGGNAGMKPDDVAGAIGMSPLELQRLLRDIDAGGVIRPTSWGNVSVQPQQLRSVLVVANFYQPYSISVKPFLDVAASQSSALRSLVQAARYGREPSELRSLLTEWSSELFEDYAWLGPDHCRWVLRSYPQHLIEVVHPALYHVPEEVLPQLIAAAKGDHRPLHSTTDHPLRLVQDWCQAGRPGTGQAVSRREMVVEAALRYLDDTGDIDTASFTFAQALTTDFRDHYTEPGSGVKGTLVWTVLKPEEITAVLGLWRRCCDHIRGRNDLSWRTLLDMARHVASPTPVRNEESVAESRAAARKLRGVMALDLFELGQGHPGVAYEARHLAEEGVGLPEESEQERLYALFFGEHFDTDYKKHEAEVTRQLAALAEEWSTEEPEVVMEVLARLCAAARDVRSHGTDRRRALIHRVVDSVDIMAWLQAAMKRNLDQEVVTPLLRKAAMTSVAGWVDAAHACVGTSSESAAIACALLAGGPENLMGRIVPLLPRYTGLVGQLCILKELSLNTIRRLLSHPDDCVASESAIHLWHGLDGHIEEHFKPEWRGAILRSNDRVSWIGGILSTDATLAFEWFTRQIRTGNWRTLMDEHVTEEAVKSLSEEQRVQLLLTLTKSLRYNHVVQQLVGDSVDIFRSFLELGGSPKICLTALERPKDEVWVQLVITGHDFGVSVDELARASNMSEGFWGSEAANLHNRIREVAPYLDDPRNAVRVVARRMTELLTVAREKALVQEREERVWGID